MTVRKDTIWKQFLQPIFQFVVDTKQLKQLYDQIDWQQGSDRFKSSDLVYPHYYANANFHGINGGYLNPEAAITYDPVTQYALPPNETWVRQAAIDKIGGQPNRILDLGCGTGSTTLMLKQTFPQAEVIGLDLSPYMLVMADYKAKQAGVEIEWIHAKAEATDFPNERFDLVTISLLFHETPAIVSGAILRECFRILVPGGSAIVLDGNQKTLRQTEWLTNIFEEPYINNYAEESVDAWMGAAGFEAVQTDDVWMVHQVTRGLKPLLVENTSSLHATRTLPENSEEVLEPAFGTI
jgi:ubiquinone/menaquinone biosynthesis C-methylase UbiE